MEIENIDNIVEKYINAEDIDGYELEDLENDVYFMIRVIKHPLGKGMHIYASDKVKQDPLFIKEVIPLLKDNFLELLLFVKDFLSNQVKTKKEKIKKLEEDGKIIPFDLDYSIISKEIIITLGCLMDKKENVDLIKDIHQTAREHKAGLIGAKSKYKYKGKEFDKEKVSEINYVELLIRELIIDIKTEETLLFYIQDGGFSLYESNARYKYIVDEYKDSPILKEFFTKMILDDIFEPRDNTLEDLIHKYYKQEDLENINTFMVNFIDRYDSLLSNHAGTNLEILYDYKKKISKIKNNWENYENWKATREKELSLMKKSKLIEDAIRYMDAHNLFIYSQRLYAIISVAARFLNTAKELIDSEIEDLEPLHKKEELSFEEYGLFKYILEKINKYYIEGDTADLLEESVYEMDESNKADIIKF